MIPSNDSGTSGGASKAWTQARKWKAERDALLAQIDANSSGSAGEVSKAWTQARKWKADRDALLVKIDANSSGSAGEVSKAWAQALRWKSECDLQQTEYNALMNLVWVARRDMPFWKQHADHLHPIFVHLHNAGYTV